MSWEENYEMAKEYYECNGNIKVSRGYRARNGILLEMWLSQQIHYYNKGKLDINKINKLEKIGIVWNTNEKRWNDNYEIAKKVYLENGTINVPAKYCINDIKFGYWIARQRKNYHKGILDIDKIEKLEKLKIKWNIDDEVWFKNYEILKDYYKKNKNIDVKGSYVTENGVTLGRWLIKQRTNYNKGILSIDKIKLLEDLEIVWDVFEDKWEEKYAVAKLLRETEGSINVPKEYKFNNITIGEWLYRQRVNYYKKKLSSEKILKLERLGIDWSSRNNYDELWNSYYKLAKEYYKANKELLITRDYVVNGVKLGQWIIVQRNNYKSGNLTSERISLLEKIGMVWDKNEALWNRMFKEAQKFYNKYGHLSVPQKYVTETGLNLGTWISVQRRAKKGSSNAVITQKQIELLEEIGMIWDLEQSSHKTSFNEQAIYYYLTKYTNYTIINRYIDLGFELDIFIPEINFAIEYDGDLHAGRNANDYEKNNKCIDNEIKLLRIREKLCNCEFDNCICINLTDYSNNQMEQAIYSLFKLIDININRSFINLDKDSDNITKQFYIYTDLLWEQWYELAKEYYNKNGNLLIERSYKTENGRNLGQWICRQRRAKKTSQYLLNEEQIKKLDSIGMVWGVRENSWNSYYDFAKKYYSKNGTINVSQDFILDGITFGRWVAQQRAMYRKGKLKKERIEKLEDLSIEWYPIDKIRDEWDKYYLSAKRYYEKNGDLRIPPKYIDENGRRLGLWIERQRRALKPSQYSISEEQIKKLNDIGMIWKARN